MRRSLVAAALALALALGTALPAHADPSIWVQCDGQPRPEGAATTAARVGAMVFIPIIGLLAAGETGTGTPAAVGQPGVDACTQALADPALAGFWQRHLNILRSRAIHYVEVGDHQSALADLAAMHGVADGQTDSPLLDRTIVVSALLIEAALRARADEIGRARELALQAAEARPYSLPIQQVALGFFYGSATFSDDERRLMMRQISYDPTAALRLPFRLDQTDDVQGAADGWEAALAANDHMTVPGLDARMGWAPEEGPDGYTLLRAAIAMARAGRNQRAIELAELSDQKLGAGDAGAGDGDAMSSVVEATEEAEAADTSDNLAAARRAQVRAQVADTLATSAAPYRPLMQAWLAVGRGDDAAALAIVQANFERLPKAMATADLLRRLQQNPTLGPQVPEFLIQAAVAGARPDPAQRYTEVDLEDWIRALPQFERVDGGARYRPGRSVGYSERETDEGYTRITYSGGAVYAGPEMLLLRASELAQERGYDSFLVYSFQRPHMEVTFFNAAAPLDSVAARASRGVVAADVIANLGPIYIDIPAASEAERRGRRNRND